MKGRQLESLLTDLGRDIMILKRFINTTLKGTCISSDVIEYLDILETKYLSVYNYCVKRGRF